MRLKGVNWCYRSRSQSRTGAFATGKRMEANHHRYIRSTTPRNRARVRRPEPQSQEAFLSVSTQYLGVVLLPIPSSQAARRPQISRRYIRLAQVADQKEGQEAQ